MSDWLLYGANGYSAQLATERAVALGMRPVLAGRSHASVQEVARRFGLDHLVFDLSDQDALVSQLQGFRVVAHCAGPFFRTAEQMMLAALAARVHYVDISGEIPTFDLGQSLHGEAQAGGVVLCPGVGFDVIPTDCVAACLKEALPDASELSLSFAGDMGLSHGTLTTLVEGLSNGFFVREAGNMKKVRRTYGRRRIDFGKGPVPVAVFPWGDLSTAYWTTGIPNIRDYLPYAGGLPELVLSDALLPVLGLGLVQRFIKSKIKPGGPDAASRAVQLVYVWGEVKNASGQVRTAHLTTAHGYTVTAEGIVTAVRQLLAHPPAQGGYFTPSQLLGARAIERFEGASKIEIS